nr:hypothetical protein GCM10025730_22190 [Promicromonospora thailandica]
MTLVVTRQDDRLPDSRWRTSRHSASGPGAACVQAAVAERLPDGLVVLPDGSVDRSLLRTAVVPEVGQERAGLAVESRADADRLAVRARTVLGKLPADVAEFFVRQAVDIMAAHHRPFPLVIGPATSPDTSLERVRDILAHRMYVDLGWTVHDGWPLAPSASETVDRTAGVRQLSATLGDLYETWPPTDRAGLRGGRAGREVETGIEVRSQLELRAFNNQIGATRLITSPGGTVSLVLDGSPTKKKGDMIVELVTSADFVLGGEAGTDPAETASAERSMLARLRRARPGQSLTDVFPVDAGYVAHPHARKVKVGADVAPGRLDTQMTAGVPVIGIRQLLRLALEHPTQPDSESVRHGHSALAFGDTVGARFIDLDPRSRDLAARLDRREPGNPVMAYLRHYLTLVYTHTAAQIHGSVSETHIKKHFLLVAARVSMARIRSSLPGRPRTGWSGTTPSSARNYSPGTAGTTSTTRRSPSSGWAASTRRTSSPWKCPSAGPPAGTRSASSSTAPCSQPPRRSTRTDRSASGRSYRGWTRASAGGRTCPSSRWNCVPSAKRRGRSKMSRAGTTWSSSARGRRTPMRARSSGCRRLVSVLRRCTPPSTRGRPTRSAPHGCEHSPSPSQRKRAPARPRAVPSPYSRSTSRVEEPSRYLPPGRRSPQKGTGARDGRPA